MLTIKDWLSSIQYSTVGIPSAYSVQRSILQKYDYVMPRKSEDQSITVSPFRLRFFLLVKDGRTKFDPTEGVEGFVQSKNLEDLEIELITKDLTYKKDDSFIINPSETDISKYGNLPISVKKYLCHVTRSSIGTHVLLDIPEGGKIDLTGNTDW